jgi:hypothetical protein
MMPEFIFDRQQEREAIRERLRRRRACLIHGPAGVGKSLLIRNVLPEFSSILYCQDSTTIQAVFRSLAHTLLRLKDSRLQRAFRNEDAIKTKSAVSLKGIVMDALHDGDYCIVLDQLQRPSYSFAAAVREILGWGSTPVFAVGRSSHMEDIGFLQSFYPDRSDKYEIRNFDAKLAEEFAREVVKRAAVSAQNLGEFLEKVLDFSEGNPGAIGAMIQMASHPKYRIAEHIKIAPLYIDFRLTSNALMAR